MAYGPISLAILGLWVILQTTKGPLAEKLGLIAGGGPAQTVTPPGSGPIAGQGGGPELWKNATAPPGAPPGQYRVDQNGNWETLVGGTWVPYAVGSPGYA